MRAFMFTPFTLSLSKGALSSLALLCACLPPQEDPSTVKDLRVLGASFEPPELMAPKCIFASLDGGIDQNTLIQVFGAYAAPVQMRWLIADPDGGGRPIAYELRACANQNDARCDDEGDFAVLKSGSTDAGELSMTLQPGLSSLNPDGGLFREDGGVDLLLQEVLSQDTYKGLGGLRLPLVLHVTAGDEQIYAQKLMVFSCAWFPEMRPNLTPVLPGLSGDGKPWLQTAQASFVGPGPFVIEPDDFSSAIESYQVPSYQLEPIQLVEAWKIAWYSDMGRVSPNETGGADLGGQESRHRVSWSPARDATEPRDVEFYFVVRDGRGGESWLRRRAHWAPK